ncbi:MAG: hypothetical protein MJ162_01305 [Treponema sp.]|nr:hypothetical protein [Treponema sp.]
MRTGIGNCRQFKYSLICVLLLLCAFSLFAEGEVTTITITNARETSYKKDPVTQNDTIVLEGNVELSVKKGGTSSEIKADKITYDRLTEMLYAEGSVEITTKSSGSGGEKSTASSLLMNTATLEGVFEDGRVVQTQSDALNLPSGSTLIVFSDVFGKTESNTIAFKNSSLTFCDDENPHWKIDATRTWLLPGGEFAFFNALLYVGPVPVLYLPAFYYPKDELIFNPVLGYRKREGYFTQTTTYLIGRKALNNDSSIEDENLQALYNFMKPTTLKVQERQGLMLHNLDENFSGTTNSFLKLDTDLYSNLGAMIGLEGAFSPSQTYLTNLKFTAQVGLSNTVFQTNNLYLPISSAGLKYFDKSNFMGLKVPFRYGGNLDLTLSKPFNFTLSLPVYSDPYFSSDFKTRSESMDWISFFMNSDRDDNTSSEVSSLIWKINASYSPTIPAVLKPYISSLSVNLNSSINISTTQNSTIGEDSRASANDNWTSYTPERKFYYPSQITPANISMSLSGTLFQWPKNTSASVKAPSYSVALSKPDELKTAAEIKKEEEDKIAAEKAKAEAEKTDEEKAADAAHAEELKRAEEEKKNEFVFLQPEFPELSLSSPSVNTFQGLTYKLGYTLNPNIVTQYAYATTEYDEFGVSHIYLNSPEDFKWSKVKSFMYTIKSPLSVNSNLNYGGSFISLTNRLSYDPVWQGHPNTDGYNESGRKTLILADYKAESQTVSNTNTLSIKPFTYVPAFADTGVSWNSTMKLFRRKFIGDEDNPEWENLGPDWDDADSVTSHTLDFTIAAKEADSKFRQNFTYTTTLPPQTTKHSFALNLDFPYVTTSFGTSFQEASATDKTLVYNPIQQSMTVSLFDSKLKISESFNYAYNLNNKDWSDKTDFHPDSLKLSMNWKSLSASYVMSYTNDYELIPGTGWKMKEDKNFYPYSVSLSYSPSVKTLYAWKNRISFTPGFSTNLTADLIRPTNSYFSITPSLTFKINEFLNVSFSSTSRNSILYWYFNEGLYDQGLFGLNYFPFNMLQDLADSFRFDSRALREGSGFKLKNLSMSVSHELDDWSFNMIWKFEPRLVTKNGKKAYDFNPYISIGVVWTPMPSIKTTIVDNYGTWQLNKEK